MECAKSRFKKNRNEKISRKKSETCIMQIRGDVKVRVIAVNW